MVPMAGRPRARLGLRGPSCDTARADHVRGQAPSEDPRVRERRPVPMIAKTEVEPNAGLRESELPHRLNREPRPIRCLEHGARLARLMPGLPPQSPCEKGVDDCNEDVEDGGDGHHRAVVLVEPCEDLVPHPTAPSP